MSQNCVMNTLNTTNVTTLRRNH